MSVLTSKGHHDGNFLSFRFHLALLACLRWSLGTLGLPWVSSDGHWGPICHLWGPMGRLLGVMWFHLSPWGGPLDAFGGHWVSLVPSLLEPFGPFENALTQVSDFLCH